ncbi:MAG TPA: carboxylesterase family protein [Actinopolymorphaceae bacterium]|jgi:para-nitrobenzyl esterase
MNSLVRRLLIMISIGCLAGVVVIPGVAEAHRHGPLVRLDSGWIRGSDDGTVREFLGIRFARPPTGDRRWRPPAPVRPWHGIADATKPGEQCVQLQAGRQVGSEDCLFLNVTAPSKRPKGKRLPVMVWLHGGGYTTGTGSAYDARRLVEQGDVIVVTPNYRLGVFGYLGLPGLRGSGTFGLADQLAALRWTKRNAAAFGGDPHNVTLFGESAGGMSACALLTSPAARGLFAKVIIQSGSCMIEWVSGTYVPIPGMPTFTPYTSLAANQETGKSAAQQLGCPEGEELDCLRDKPVAELMQVNDSFASNLAYGTPLLPLEPAKALRKGQFLRVPVLSGGTKDEGNGFIAGAAEAGFPVTEELYPELVKGAFGDAADKVLAEYPLTDYRSPALAWATIASDRAWSCPTLDGNQAMAEHTRVYAYEFADQKAPNIGNVPDDFPPGAQHGSELPYLFDLGGEPWPTLTDDQWQLADQMIGYWTSFAHSGRPHAAGAPTWRPMRSGDTRALSLVPASQGGIEPVDVGAEHRCDFWNEL